MNNYFEQININQIKRAIEIEEKYKYIDIMGKEAAFSGFMLKQLRIIYKSSKKNPKWLPVIEAFEHYAQENIFQRKKTISRFVSVLKQELNPKQDKESCAKTFENTSLYDADVVMLKGVGPKFGYLLNKLGIFSVFDLISYYPRKYIDYSSRCLIRNLKVSENVTICGKITSIQSYTTKNNLTIIKVTIMDESGSLDLSFFYSKINKFSIERYKSQFPKYSYIIVSGCVKFDKYNKQMTIDKPQYQIISEDSADNENLNLARIVPIYPLVENLNIKALRKAIHNALTEYTGKIEDLIPEHIMMKHEMLHREEALKIIHFPETNERLEKARFTLVYEELFLLQLKMLYIKDINSKSYKTTALNIKDDGLVKTFIKNLPFELTGAQKRAINEILNDINSEKPMQRLLQGDVGSGKTVVACIMLLAAIENGFQTAIMAPTEILAQQHFNNFVNWLTPMGINVALFTSSNSKKLRNQLEKDLRNGQINIAVGTHSLIQDEVEFNNLGAIVIDEQHRFGVKQRNRLKTKAKIPQMLTMTATPIPRTLALTCHGDLDLTIIDELPRGRKPVKTALITASQRKKALNLIREEVNKGYQAYIVFPLIEESETLSAKAATKEAEQLQAGEFSDLKVGLLHGKMKTEEKDKIMLDFKNKLYDVLVCTTVVEVGVDVPNATVIVIENAERFGLSQLHQLRGRVGRNSIQSYCVLVSSSRNEETQHRLNVLVQTNDGFVIAEKDLEIRGPGEFLGVKQSGLAELHLADLTKDLYILEMAREEAKEYLKEFTKENMPKNLQNYLSAVLGAASELNSPD
ncbi:MAG: ATP-dependent DNA helicase RecG [Candidatus Gastranaerophilales bacterium]|nr:ATP-dependent DNA helicase RecG [Candidatus Gastranaerophilales bacterium]